MSQLFALLNHRMDSERQTVITSNYSGRELQARLAACGEPETANAIISRLATFQVIRFEGQDRRLGGAR